MSCLVHSMYNMKADIYESEATQDENTGVIIKSWSLKESVECLVKPILSSSLRADSASTDIQNYLIAVSNIIKVRTSDPISSSYRVVNVRNSDGLIYRESDVITSAGGFQGSTIFEPRGSTPVIDFNGSIIEWETNLHRQEIQRLDV